MGSRRKEFPGTPECRREKSNLHREIEEELGDHLTLSRFREEANILLKQRASTLKIGEFNRTECRIAIDNRMTPEQLVDWALHEQDMIEGAEEDHPGNSFMLDDDEVCGGCGEEVQYCECYGGPEWRLIHGY